MKEKSLILPAHDVRAILDGRKSQFRVVIRPQPPMPVRLAWVGEDGYIRWIPVGSDEVKKGGTKLLEVGMCVWVKERFLIDESAPYADGKSDRVVVYRVDYKEEDLAPGWKPARQMQRQDSRLILEVTAVRIQRLQEISEEDAVAEGFSAREVWKMWHILTDRGSYSAGGDEPVDGTRDRLGNIIRGHARQIVSDATSARDEFHGWWDRANYRKGHGWDKNEWVEAVTFKRV